VIGPPISCRRPGLQQGLLATDSELASFFNLFLAA
jgi:hypothetical protein